MYSNLFHLNRYYELFYYENINKFKLDLEKYFEVLDYEIKVFEKEKYYQYEIENIAVFNIYSDSTVKVISYDNKKEHKIPNIEKEILKYYKITQYKLNEINSKLFEILNYSSHNNLIINYISNMFFNNFSEVEVINFYDKQILRYKPGYCFELNNNGIRVLYSLKKIKEYIND